MNPDSAEGKTLLNPEIEQGLECPINSPTRVQMQRAHVTQSLVAVILTSQRELFSNCGTYNPEIGDHVLIYGSIKENLDLGKAGLSNLDPRGILTRNTTRRTFVMLRGMLATLSIQLMIKLVSGKHL